MVAKAGPHRTLHECRCDAFVQAYKAEIEKLRAEVARLHQWVEDCQAGMYINCVYCGHRYGPNTEVPASMADVLKKHVEQCPDHPMSALRKEVEGLRERTAACPTCNKE
jgi:DNA-directed RNA polymerase subunit RPC12/RpoP